ncbi:MAG: cadmium resistance transporter [Gemmatimonadota bacterium]|jgi:cadmium resistance protein CadD (predicted permease)
MPEILAIIGLTVAAFVSTGVDNLLLLVGFKGQPAAKDAVVNLAFLGAFLVVLLIGFSASFAADVVPARYIGYLGAVPLTLGVVQLVQAVRGRAGGPAVAPSEAAGPWTVGLTMLANNGDSLAVLASLFAETRHPFTLFIAGTALGMALLWTAIAGWVARHPATARRVRRWGPYVLPLVLILVGWYILSDTVTDTLQ